MLKGFPLGIEYRRSGSKN